MRFRPIRGSLLSGGLAIRPEIGYNFPMTLTIDLPPEVADTLTRKAAQQGRDVAGYIRQLAVRDSDSRDAAQTALGRRTANEPAAAGHAYLPVVGRAFARGDKSLSLHEKRPSDVRKDHVGLSFVRRTSFSSERSLLPRIYPLAFIPSHLSPRIYPTLVAGQGRL